MAGLNGQIHLYLETDLLKKVNKEAKKLNISRSEYVRRQLSFQTIQEEIILLKKLKQLIKNGKK